MIAAIYSQLRRPEAKLKDLRVQHRVAAMRGPSLRCVRSGRQEPPVSAVSATPLVVRTGRPDRCARFVRGRALWSTNAPQPSRYFPVIKFELGTTHTIGGGSGNYLIPHWPRGERRRFLQRCRRAQHRLLVERAADQLQPERQAVLI